MLSTYQRVRQEDSAVAEYTAKCFHLHFSRRLCSRNAALFLWVLLPGLVDQTGGTAPAQGIGGKIQGHGCNSACSYEDFGT